MENIKSNFDRIMEKFNDGLTHTPPHDISYLSNSYVESPNVTKKRRISYSYEESPCGSANVSTNVSGASMNSTAVPASPWETRRMRVDLIESKTRVTKLKQEIERQHRVRAEMETLLQSKVSELTKQCEFSSNKILDMEKHMQVVRKREQAAKHELLKTQKEATAQKHSYEDALHKLQRNKQEAEEEASMVQNSMSNELSDYRRHTEKIEMELDLLNEELANMRDLLDEYKPRASAYDELKLQLEKEEQGRNTADLRIKELEYQISSYEDWQEITKNSQTRLLSIPGLDTEIERLRAKNKELQDLLGNNLLLEEQVHDLRTRLEQSENAKAEAVTLQVKLTHCEQELKEWVQVAQDHCLPNMLVSPMALRSRIEQLLQNDIIMVSEKNCNKSETKSMESQMQDWKQKCKIYVKNIEDLNVALKRHTNFKDRVQKKLLLVSKERDLYKQLLENFEKDLTISNTTNAMDIANPETQLRYRLDMLEKTLGGYKEMCANLEKDLCNAKQLSTSTDSFTEANLNAESYEHYKREIDGLRLENERLSRRKEELELELEHRCLKGDFQLGKFKVVHLSKGPAAEAYANSTNIQEKLQAEIERLKRRNQKLEDDNDVTLVARLNDTSNMTMNIKEVNQLRAELETTNNKMKKLKEFYKSASMEFREVCYMLFGYRIDRVGTNTNYKVSSMYAESPDDYLNFRLTESNVLDMLETPYSVTLKPLIESQLGANRSLPAFLSSLTLDLFQRATVTMA